MSKERTNSIYSMHTIDMMFNNSISIMVGMNSKKIEKENGWEDASTRWFLAADADVEDNIELLRSVF